MTKTVKTSAVTVGGFTLARVNGAVGELTKAAKAAQAAEAKGGENFMTKVRAMIPTDGKGKPLPLTESQWTKSVQPLFKRALDTAYPQGYGPRLSWAKVVVLGLSRGLAGPSGLRQYYEAVRPVLEAEGAKKQDKRGAQPKVGGSKVQQAEAAKAKANVTLAAKGDTKAATQAATLAKAISSPKAGSAASATITTVDGDGWRAAAMVIFGSPSLASKMSELFANDQDAWKDVCQSFTGLVNIALDKYNARVGK